MNGIAGLAAIALLAGVCASAQAAAQTMYRCGKTYQDRPCDAGQQGKAIGSTAAAVPSAAPGGARSDAECGALGVQAQKIVWGREGGLSREQQLVEIQQKPVSGVQKEKDRKLVAEVYSRRGTSVEIRAAIEAECLAEKDREAQAAAMAKALGLKPGAAAALGTGVGPAAAPQPSEEERKAAEAQRQQHAAARAAEDKKRLCQGLNRRSEQLRSEERAGGSAKTMERLAERRREVNSEMRDAGC